MGEIKQIQSKIARLQEEKTASNAEKAALKQRYNNEMRALKNTLVETQSKVTAVTNHRNKLVGELGTKNATLQKTQRQLSETRKIVNSLRQSKVAGQWQGARLGAQLKTAQTNLQTALTTANAQQSQILGRIQHQNRIQAQLKQARQSAQNYKAAARRNVGPQFNATGAFQNMGNKLAANRNAWKRAGGRWQGAQSGVKAQENLRVAKNALYTIINSHRKNGNWTIGGPVGWKRQTLRHKVNTATNMNQIKEARRLVAAAKKEKNFKVRSRENKSNSS